MSEEKTLEIVQGDYTYHKLTVTPTRVSIKLIASASDEEKRTVKEKAGIVAERLRDVKRTFRGKFHTFDQIDMFANPANSGHITVRFDN
jgi:hypothetical protein